MQEAQGADGELELFFVFVFRETEEFVDIAAATDDVDFAVVVVHLCHFIFKFFHYVVTYGVVEEAYGADVVAFGGDHIALVDERGFSASPAYVNVHIGTFFVREVLYVVTVKDACFFATCDEVDVDTCLLFDAFEDGFAVFGITHSAGGAGAVVDDFVHAHHLFESFYHTHHHLCTLFTYFPFGEYVHS